MKTVRIGIIGVVAASALGLGLQGCFAKQPAPECSVQLAAYWVQLKEVNRTAGCDPAFKYDSVEMGMERFHPPFTKDFSVGMKNEILQDMLTGTDVSEYSGLPTNPWPGTPRTDPSDPDAKNVFHRAKLTAFPDADGKCLLTDFTGGVQNFQDEGAGFPATTVKLEWSDFKINMVTTVPGTAFTGTLKYSESASNCTMNYEARGFWPIVGCTIDEDCNPFENPDGGLYDGGAAAPTYQGSGIPPVWKPRCNTVQSVCEPTVDLMSLK